MHIAHTFSSLQTYGKMISRNTTTQNRAVVPLWNTKDQLLVRKKHSFIDDCLGMQHQYL